MDTNNTPTETLTDEDLLAAIRRGVEIGAFTVVDENTTAADLMG